MYKVSIAALMAAFCIGSATQAKPLEENIAYCESCHGQDGISQEDDIPIIAGLSDIAISDILNAYRDDTRSAIDSKFRHSDTSRPETNMNEITKNLDGEEIEALAEYYSNKDFVAAKQSFDPDKAAIGAKIHKVQCTKCHEDGGSSSDDDVGILAGQWTPYLRTALTNFRSGKRQTEDKMLKLVKKLSAEELDALLNYWASQQ